MRENRHAFEHRRRAAGHELPLPGRFLPLNFRNAHAAGAGRVIQRQQRAERRNENPEALRDLQNRFPFLKRSPVRSLHSARSFIKTLAHCFEPPPMYAIFIFFIIQSLLKNKIYYSRKYSDYSPGNYIFCKMHTRDNSCYCNYQ